MSVRKEERETIIVLARLRMRQASIPSTQS